MGRPCQVLARSQSHLQLLIIGDDTSTLKRYHITLLSPSPGLNPPRTKLSPKTTSRTPMIQRTRTKMLCPRLLNQECTTPLCQPRSTSWPPCSTTSSWKTKSTMLRSSLQVAPGAAPDACSRLWNAAGLSHLSSHLAIMFAELSRAATRAEYGDEYGNSDDDDGL